MKLKKNVTRTKIRPKGRPLKTWNSQYKKDDLALREAGTIALSMGIRLGMLGTIVTSSIFLLPLLVRADSLTPSINTSVNESANPDSNEIEITDFTSILDTPVETPSPNPIAADSAVAPTPEPTESPSQPSEPAPTATGILTPTAGAVLDTPATIVILRFPASSEVTLQVNGEAIDPKLIGRTETDSQTNLTTQTWYGVPLSDGQNTITAQIVTNGIAQVPISVNIAVSGAPSEITVEPAEATIAADGRSTATITGELLDDNGNRSNRDAIVTLEANEGEFTGVDANLDQPGFQVAATRGQYTATLRSSLNAGIVRIRASAGQLEAFNQIEFATSLRPTLIAGTVNLHFGRRGSDYFGSFRDFLPADGKDNYEFDLQGAVFGTTQVGEWQLTGAYNSDRPLNRACDGTDPLFREGGDCDNNYPIYGDGSTTDLITPSTDQVYLRLERTSPQQGAGSDFIMWGDYSTSDQFAERSQLFTATSRELHGAYGNYNIGRLRVTGFYGNNVEGFQRDTIAPDGTSGNYFVSQRLIIAGSENIFLETEELNRPGTVLETEQLSRGVDYQIDYDRGSILFNDPVLRTGVDDKGRVLVRRIIVTYQYESGETANIYGGRLQYNLSRELNQESWIGGTYIRENQGSRNFELYGADALISFGQDGQLIAEYAHSSNDSIFSGNVDGSAYRLEATGTLFGNVEGNAYYRSTDTGFSNNATSSFVAGQTRYGAEITAPISEETTLRASYDHEDNFGTAPRPLDDLSDLLNRGQEATPGSRVDNSLTTITAGVEQRIGDATLGLDWVHRDRQDRINPQFLNETSDQLRSRLSIPLTSTLAFRAQNELNLGSGRDPLYPSRTILGLDWKFDPNITLSLNQQFFSTQRGGDNAITSLDLTGEHHFDSDTTLNGRFSFMPDHGLSGVLGVEQGITIAPGLRATLAYEHIFASEFNNTGSGAQFPQPYAPGQSGSSIGVQDGDSYSVGLAYTDNPNFQANARFEHRSSSSGSNTVINAAALGRITPSFTALLDYQQANSSNQRLSALGTSSTLRLGLAYRNPNDDTFNALLRYEYQRNPSEIPDSLLYSSGSGSQSHLFALEAIYAPDWRWEFYGKFALRNSTSYLASDLVGTSTITLSQMRATYRLNYRWDVAAEARWISQASAGYDEMGASVEAGYYMSPNLRLYGGYSFGRVNNRDFGNDRAIDGFFAGITIKLDNQLFSDFDLHDVAPPQQQESAQPVAAETPTPTVSVEP
jgi:Invasin, domain 3